MPKVLPGWPCAMGEVKGTLQGAKWLLGKPERNMNIDGVRCMIQCF